MKKLMLMIVLLALALSAYAAFTAEDEYVGYRGAVEIRDGKPWLKELWGEEMRLLLGPQELLDTLGLVLADGDSIAVEGFLKDGLFLVSKLWNETKGSNLYWLRHLDYGSFDDASVATYVVEGDKCIGCKLCVPNCPLGAITMVKGKAQIDPEKCIECGICIEGFNKFKGCPVKAIHK